MSILSVPRMIPVSAQRSTPVHIHYWSLPIFQVFHHNRLSMWPIRMATHELSSPLYNGYLTIAASLTCCVPDWSHNRRCSSITYWLDAIISLYDGQYCMGVSFLVVTAKHVLYHVSLFIYITYHQWRLTGQNAFKHSGFYTVPKVSKTYQTEFHTRAQLYTAQKH